MAFQSFEFVFFLAIVIVLFFFVPPKIRIWVLVCANVFFCMYAELSTLIWLLISIISTWAAAMIMTKTDDKVKRQGVLFITIVVNLMILTGFKYLPVWNEWFNSKFGMGHRKVAE